MKPLHASCFTLKFILSLWRASHNSELLHGASVAQILYLWAVRAGLIFSIALLPSVEVYGQVQSRSEVNQSEDAFERTVRVDFAPDEFGRSQIRIDLGEIPAEGTGKLVILARNVSSSDVEFGDSFTGCKCIQVKFSKTKVQPGEESEIELIFKVEKEPV